MLALLLLACSDPADPPSAEDTAAPADTGEDEPLCPGWSGLHPGATNTRHTTAEWIATMGGDVELVEVVTLDGEEVVRTRAMVGTTTDASLDYHLVERFRCDEAGAWLLVGDMLNRTTYDDGEVSEIAAVITYESDHPYYPRAIAVGDSTSVTLSYSINGDTPREDVYTFTVQGFSEVTVAAGTYSAWEITLPLNSGPAWYADPEGLVLDHAYELTAFSAD